MPKSNTPRDSLNESRLLEDAADGVALISIPIHLSGKQGHDHDFQIEKKRPVVDIVKIILNTASHLLESIRVSTVSIGLRPTRDTGLDVVATGK
jgi:hypothetical protein